MNPTPSSAPTAIDVMGLLTRFDGDLSEVGESFPPLAPGEDAVVTLPESLWPAIANRSIMARAAAEARSAFDDACKRVGQAMIEAGTARPLKNDVFKHRDVAPLKGVYDTKRLQLERFNELVGMLVGYALSELVTEGQDGWEIKRGFVAVRYMNNISPFGMLLEVISGHIGGDITDCGNPDCPIHGTRARHQQEQGPATEGDSPIADPRGNPPPPAAAS